MTTFLKSLGGVASAVALGLTAGAALAADK